MYCLVSGLISEALFCWFSLHILLHWQDVHCSRGAKNGVQAWCVGVPLTFTPSASKPRFLDTKVVVFPRESLHSLAWGKAPGYDASHVYKPLNNFSAKLLKMSIKFNSTIKKSTFKVSLFLAKRLWNVNRVFKKARWLCTYLCIEDQMS